MQATKQQKREIHKNKPTEDIKEEWVQWATEDVAKISTNALTFDEANKIIVHIICHRAHTWGDTDYNDNQHRYIFRLAIDVFGRTYDIEQRNFIPNLEKFSLWLKSTRCPVQKPIRMMDKKELSKIISALESMTKKKFN